MALTTIAEYKAWANITNTASDARLTVMLGVAQSVVRGYGRRNETNGFESATRTEKYGGKGATSIILRERPVTSITSVKYIDDDGVETTLPAATYRIKESTGILTRNGDTSRLLQSYPLLVYEPGPSNAWADGDANYSITYVGGYATIPDGLKLAVWMSMDILLQTQGRGGLQSESIGGEYSYTIAPNKPTEGPWYSVFQMVRGY